MVGTKSKKTKSTGAKSAPKKSGKSAKASHSKSASAKAATRKVAGKVNKEISAIKRSEKKASDNVRRYLHRGHRMYIFGAVVAILFGLFALFAPVWTLKFFVIIAAIALIIIGLVSIITSLAHVGSRGWGMHFLLGLVELAAGIILCFNTGAALWLVMTVVGSFILVRSVLEVVLGAKFKDDGADKALMIISGLIGTVLGILVLVNTQASASIVMILLGAYSLVFGAMSLLYGARTHKVLHKR